MNLQNDTEGCCCSIISVVEAFSDSINYNKKTAVP